MRFKKASDVKWYLYMSDSKLDMLFRQVASPDRERKTIEWSLDAKIAKLGRKKETEEASDRDAQLRAVVVALEESECIGTIESPKEYVRGTLPMRWGLLKDVGRPNEEPPLVFFGGEAGDTVFGFGGSSRHVIGNYGASATGSRSATPYLISHLLSGLGLPLEGWNAPHPLAADDYDYQTFIAVILATEHLLKKQGPTQNLEFLAKTLITDTYPNPYREDRRTNFVLGTPLYVALSRPLPAEFTEY